MRAVCKKYSSEFDYYRLGSLYFSDVNTMKRQRGSFKKLRNSNSKHHLTPGLSSVECTPSANDFFSHKTDMCPYY